MRIFGDVLGGHTKCPSFDSLACAIGDTASAIDLLCPWQLFVRTFSATCSCHVGKEIMIFLVPRETHEQPAPQRVSITAYQNNQQPTTGNPRHPQQQTTTPPPPQQLSTTSWASQECRKNSNNTSHSYSSNNSGNRQHQATTATIVPSSCVPEHTLSRIDARACAQRKSQAAATTAATKKNVTWHQTVWKLRRSVRWLRFRNPPPSCPEPQNARASRQNRGGLSTTSILRAKLF